MQQLAEHGCCDCSAVQDRPWWMPVLCLLLRSMVPDLWCTLWWPTAITISGGWDANHISEPSVGSAVFGLQWGYTH